MVLSFFFAAVKIITFLDTYLVLIVNQNYMVVILEAAIFMISANFFLFLIKSEWYGYLEYVLNLFQWT